MTTGDYTAESFHAYEYLDHLKRRWKLVLAVCAAAGALALIVSLILPKEYTATASITIELPAGTDVRTSINVTPVYLESLRGYETFASNDNLFLRAVDKFHLRQYPSQAVEALKRKILKVVKMKDTKILQISATLDDPKRAQAVAQFIAEETVSASRATSLADEQDRRDSARAQLAEAQRVLDAVQAASREFAIKSPFESLRDELEAISATRERLSKDLADSRAELAEGGNLSDPRSAAIRARIQSLEKQDSDLAHAATQKAATLSDRDARAEQFKQKIRSAQLTYDAVAAHVQELNAVAGARGERLSVIDPGVVPERPSFPNIALNVILAMFVTLIAAGTYLTLSFRPSRA